MGFFDFLRGPDLRQGLEAYRSSPGGLLLDVRTPEEYRRGHLPGSKNIALQQLDKVGSVAENKDIPLFVYCQSGGRSRQAVALLQRMGYRSVRDLGGIAGCGLPLERA